MILVPSIAIRQQWIQRIQEGFLMDETQASTLISTQLNNPKKITIVTYQALHSCMQKLKRRLEDEEDEAYEEVDFSGFDFFSTFKDIGLGTICMDEAHHLRNEWWKSLDHLFKEFSDTYRVCLTATPPYDATPNEWKRYMDMCGAIDEEIYAPELVKEASLCPHQDYIYFNLPTKQEAQVVKEFEQHVAMCITEICTDEFTKVVASHIGLQNPEAYADTFLAQPQYFFAILIYLHEKGVPYSKYLKKLTGTKKALPKLSPQWMEYVLQGVLFHDADAYTAYNVYREQILHSLKEHGCMQRNKVFLVRNPKLDALLISSKGKLDSIQKIVAFESKHMKTSLRQLILCDYIKKEILRYVGDDTYSMKELGVIPIFEQLRRNMDASVLLGVLSGSMVIISKKQWKN